MYILTLNNSRSLFIILLLAFLPLLNSCYKPPPVPVELKYINFDKNTYPPNFPAYVKIYNSRYELPDKFFEIGAIKFKGEPSMNSVLKMAAQHGAMGIIKEGNNYILIRFEGDRNKMRSRSHEM